MKRGLPGSKKISSHEERKRFFELLSMVMITIILVGLSRLEGTLFELSERLSEHPSFLTSLIYFGLININVVLILVLSFLIFRNVIKLVVERRRGVIGSRLRTKLVIALVFFAVAPTALLFYVSNRFLTESFDTWFSSRVEATILKTKEAGALVYKRDKRRIEGLAKIAIQRIEFNDASPFFSSNISSVNYKGLEGFVGEYRLDSLRLYDPYGKLIWKNGDFSIEDQVRYRPSSFVTTAIHRFNSNPGMTSRGAVEVEEGQDVVKGIAPIRDPTTGKVLAVILTEEQFETQIIRSVEAILKEFANLKPAAKLIRLSYTILLVVVVLVILFSATWLGFYVAKGIIGPIQSLAEATREVALGNYDINLSVRTDDETGQLVRSFNRMTIDLKQNEERVRGFTQQLEKTNIELERRRKYMEIVLKNISTGVISVGKNEHIMSLNHAAEKLLSILAADCIGKKVLGGLGERIGNVFWKPISEQLSSKNSFSTQIEMQEIGHQLTLIAAGSRILDENGEDLGVVVVFDDASEQVKVQRVVAWREVARRIAHEIKNPITPIKLSAQRLLRRYSNYFSGQDQEIFNSCIETIISEVDLLRDLVNEFSKFSRLPAVTTRMGNINLLIAETISHFASSYPNIAFNAEGLSKDIPEIPIDKEQMKRALGNIISNAIAAISEEVAQGALEFKTILIDQLNIVRIEISDNGIGIPENLKSRVLEPYFSTKVEGTGLGLAIVNQIVTDHGGYLRIEDNSPIGTTISIELPMEGFGTRV